MDLKLYFAGDVLNLDIKVLDQQQWIQNLTQRNLKSGNNYFAMYSSWWNGIITDPHLMLVAVDDHQVHRGDAVFEAMKVVNNKIYLVDDHLNRWDRSAQAIGLKNPMDRSQMLQILEQTLKASKQSEAILRLFLSRGPGSFSTSPYDTEGAQVYLIVTKYQSLTKAMVENGVSLALSKISPKEPWLARIKSCNYLQNVLMKKEALDLGVDFTLGITNKGLITEGSTENLILLTHDGQLLKPKSENILLGTTMQRAFALSENISEIKNRSEKNLTLEDLKNAKEVMMVGTTLDVISVTKFEDQPVGEGSPGTVSKKLRELVIQDQI